METQARSLAKTVSWRVIATAMTFVVSYFWLQDVASSLALAIVANLLKTLAYYAHERGWNSCSWGRYAYSEGRLRSVVKSMSWRAVAAIITLGASYFWLPDLKDALLFVAAAMTVKALIYYFHERFWNGVQWGRATMPYQDEPSSSGHQVPGRAVSDVAVISGD